MWGHTSEYIGSADGNQWIKTNQWENGECGLKENVWNSQRINKNIRYKACEFPSYNIKEDPKKVERHYLSINSIKISFMTYVL